MLKQYSSGQDLRPSHSSAPSWCSSASSSRKLRRWRCEPAAGERGLDLIHHATTRSRSIFHKNRFASCRRGERTPVTAPGGRGGHHRTIMHSLHIIIVEKFAAQPAARPAATVGTAVAATHPAHMRPANYFLPATPTVLPRRPVVLVCWPRTRRPQ